MLMVYRLEGFNINIFFINFLYVVIKKKNNDYYLKGYFFYLI